VGLGLSVVDAVARLHGTALKLSDNSPGLRVSILLMQDTRPIERTAAVVANKAASTTGELQHEPIYL
jgi:hypothetical protein